MIRVFSIIFLISIAFFPQLASAEDKLFRDTEFFFRFVYPDEWALIPSRGANVRASVTSEGGKGLANCNFGVRPIPELSTLSRSELEVETKGLFSREFFESLFLDQPFTKVLESEEGKINNRPAGFAVIDTEIESVGIKLRMRGIQAITFTVDGMIIIHCGAEANYFDWYKEDFMQIIRSFVFEDFYR